MNDFKYVKEFLSTAKGTEGSLLIVKKIYDTLIGEVQKALIPRSEAAFYLGPGDIPGSSVDVDLETPDTLKIRALGEFSEAPMDTPSYTTFNVKPIKYGVALRITREMMEDGKWNLIQRNIARAGKRMAENETSLIITQLDSASNTVSGGAAITVANITRAMQYLEDADYEATTYLVGMEVANDIRNIDTFAEADKHGSNEMQIRGFLGVIYAMRVYKVSTNAGMTTTSSYVFDRAQGYLIAEKRPVTVEDFALPLLDSNGCVITQRLKMRYVRAEAIAKVTTS